jgi:hypothetical protein
MYEALIGLLGIILGALATFARERAKQNARAAAAALSITVELRTNAAKASNVVSRAETPEPSAQVATATAHTSGGAPTTKPDAELGKNWWVGDLATDAWLAGQSDLLLALNRSPQGHETAELVSNAYELIKHINQSKALALQPRSVAGMNQPRRELPPSEENLQELRALVKGVHRVPGVTNKAEPPILPTTGLPLIVKVALAAVILLLAAVVMLKPLPYRDRDVATALETAIPNTSAACNAHADGWACIVYPLGQPNNDCLLGNSAGVPGKQVCPINGPPFTEYVTQGPAQLVAASSSPSLSSSSLRDPSPTLSRSPSQSLSRSTSPSRSPSPSPSPSPSRSRSPSPSPSPQTSQSAHNNIGKYLAGELLALPPNEETNLWERMKEQASALYDKVFGR